MSALTCDCARCGEVVRVPVDSLLVVVTAGSPDAGRLAYICLSCNAFVDEALPLRGLLILLAAACAPLVLTAGDERK